MFHLFRATHWILLLMSSNFTLPPVRCSCCCGNEVCSAVVSPVDCDMTAAVQSAANGGDSRMGSMQVSWTLLIQGMILKRLEMVHRCQPDAQIIVIPPPSDPPSHSRSIYTSTEVTDSTPSIAADANEWAPRCNLLNCTLVASFKLIFNNTTWSTPPPFGRFCFE